MELPLGGPALRHYTQSRPRPHRQKLNYRPSRPQETIIESENEALEFMGRVDEGVEEFFTKRVLPTDTLKKQDEETITVHEVAPASSVPCPPQTKTLRRKLGDFFTLKKRRGLKSEASQEGRPKKASIADFIRPLREVARAEKEKEKERAKEHDRENEKEKTKEHPSAVSGESAVQETPVSGAPPLRGEAVPPRRALREGKSQSLILLSGSAAAGTTNARNTAKKQFEGQHSFEQKLHLMLQRIGVSKAQPGETQNQEGEMKKAESEGTIIDSKPEPPPTFTKPRTMSASSDTRHQIRPSVSAHESAGKPALLPKPVLKPGPPPTTSGRNTPENELAQIQEGETNTPTKLTPTVTPSAPAPALTATTTPTIPTISNSVPDSTNFTISPSSTVLPSDSDICTDSVNPTAAATTPTNVTELNSKPSITEANATITELPTATFPTTLTSTTTPTEPPATVSVTSISSESITPSLSVTSNSTTITTPSITSSDTVFEACNESPASTESTNLSTKLTFPEPNGFSSVDATPAAGGDASISVVTTASLPSTSISDMSATTNSVTEASDDSTSVTSASSLVSSVTKTTTNSVTEASDDSTSVTSASSLVSSVTKTTSQLPVSSDTITPDAPITSSSSLVPSALPPTSPTSSTTTTSPTSNDCIDSISTSTITHSVTPSPADISAPSTSSSETNPTDTTTTTTTSLNHADTTSTTDSATAAAISSPLPTDSDPPYTNNVSTTLSPTISGLPTPDSSSATSHHLTGPAPSNPGQDNDLQSFSEERSGVEPAEKETDEELEVVQKIKQSDTDYSKKVIDGRKESENEEEKPARVNSEAIKEELQEESVKPEEDAVKTEVGMAEPASWKDGELFSDEGVTECKKQEETKSVAEK
ncbi:uncharacterized protein [Chaetodon trifascialis]|uniref:uncharacterized protein isoform X1 n=1 Tax=Chaetodon trifascialis TaxID=109706 RepID=UPI003994D9B6